MLTVDTIISQFYINSYNKKSIELSENSFDKNKQKIIVKHKIESSCYISFEKLISNFNITEFNHLDFTSLAALEDIEMLLIGTGDKHVFPHKELFCQLDQLSFSVDFMDTSAACRTFNILVNEHRKVGALLFI